MEDLARYEAQEVAMTRNPEEVLQEAKRAAEALTRVLSAKPDKVFINGQQYLEMEDWSLLGKFYGLTVRVESSAPVTFGNVRGWEAHAVVVDRAGREISAADAMCLNDEEKWSTKPKYEYLYVLKDGTKTKENPPKNKIVWIDNPKKAGGKIPKKEKIKIGDEPVPFFQLRSMAQTRAMAKAFRNVLSWVVVLSGYKAISAEETDQPEPDIEEASPAQEAPKAQPSTQSPPPPGVITDEQKTNILFQLKKKNLAVEHLEGYMDKLMAKFEGVKDVNAALKWIGEQKPN